MTMYLVDFIQMIKRERELNIAKSSEDLRKEGKSEDDILMYEFFREGKKDSNGISRDTVNRIMELLEPSILKKADNSPNGWEELERHANDQ